METNSLRINNPLDYLAAAIVALALFAIPISIAFLASDRISTRIVVVFVLECLLTPPALAWLVKARGGRAMLGATLGYLLGVAVMAWVTAAIGLYVTLVVILSSSKCASTDADRAGLIGALLLYAAAGGWSLRRKGASAFVVIPIAIALAAGWVLLTWAVFPGMPGCYND